jgi:hypothetical protein
MSCRAKRQQCCERDIGNNGEVWGRRLSFQGAVKYGLQVRVKDFEGTPVSISLKRVLDTRV